MKCRGDSQTPFWPKRNIKGGVGERKHNKTVRGKLWLGTTKTQELWDVHEKMQQLVTIKMDNVREAKI